MIWLKKPLFGGTLRLESEILFSLSTFCIHSKFQQSNYLESGEISGERVSSSSFYERSITAVLRI